MRPVVEFVLITLAYLVILQSSKILKNTPSFFAIRTIKVMIPSGLKCFQLSTFKLSLTLHIYNCGIEKKIKTESALVLAYI